MDLFEHESQYSVHLREDAGEPTYEVFKEILKHELGAELIDEWWSPDICWVRFRVKDEVLTVQKETYLGIDLFGSQTLVADIRKRLHLHKAPQRPPTSQQ